MEVDNTTDTECSKVKACETTLIDSRTDDAEMDGSSIMNPRASMCAEEAELQHKAEAVHAEQEEEEEELLSADCSSSAASSNSFAPSYPASLHSCKEVPPMVQTTKTVLSDVMSSSVVEDFSVLCKNGDVQVSGPPDLVRMNVSSTGTNSSSHSSSSTSGSTSSGSSSRCASPRRRRSRSSSSSRISNGEEGVVGVDGCKHDGGQEGGELVVSWMTSSTEGEEDGDDSSSATAISTGTAVALESRSLLDQQHGSEEEDPYADVRERMEYLAKRDKMLHLGAQEESSSTEGGGGLHSGGTIQIPFFAATTTYLGFAILILVGQVRDFCAFVFQRGRYLKTRKKKKSLENPQQEFAPLLKVWESLFTRRIFHRTQDCFSRPIASNPGATIRVLERVSWDGNKSMKVLGCISKDEDANRLRHSYEQGQHFCYTPEFNALKNHEELSQQHLSLNTGMNGHHSKQVSSPSSQSVTHGRLSRECLNLGSYNYLGFADDWQTTCATPVVSSLCNLPPSVSSARNEFGTTVLHKRTEALVSQFLNKEDAIVYNMGFNTNATTIPALLRKSDLILSDELNHTSIINGARASGASIRTFRHNDPCHLEELLRDNIVAGRPKTRRPWGKIVVLVEGVYSMEGEYCNLAPILAVAKKYGAYLYLDEAHSIGACGPTGRGCCEYCGVDPAEVDVLMGTFTKSFGGSGGYVASSRRLIEYLRKNCAGSIYHNSISPVVCQQIITSFEVIMGLDGTDLGKRKIRALRDNSNYFRMRLVDMGLHVLGNYDSPIMPVMLYNPAKVPSFSRECLKRGLAVVVVGFPAVPILMSRTRFCISAAHTRAQLDRALEEIDEISGILQIRYTQSAVG